MRGRGTEGTVAPGGARMRAAAVAHAAERIEHALELSELIHELRLLRITIPRAASRGPDPGAAPRAEAPERTRIEHERIH